MGRVAAAYGIRGWIRVAAASADPLALAAHSLWWLQPRGRDEWRPVKVHECRPQGAALVASVEGIADREAAAALRGALVGVARDALPPLAANELYWAEVEGLAVVNREGVVLGTVVGMLDTGAHPVLRVRGADRPGERLIPWVEAYVDEVDAAARRVTVDWPADY